MTWKIISLFFRQKLFLNHLTIALFTQVLVLTLTLSSSYFYQNYTTDRIYPLVYNFGTTRWYETDEHCSIEWVSSAIIPWESFGSYLDNLRRDDSTQFLEWELSFTANIQGTNYTLKVPSTYDLRFQSEHGAYTSSSNVEKLNTSELSPSSISFLTTDVKLYPIPDVNPSTIILANSSLSYENIPQSSLSYRIRVWFERPSELLSFSDLYKYFNNSYGRVKEETRFSTMTWDVPESHLSVNNQGYLDKFVNFESTFVSLALFVRLTQGIFLLMFVALAVVASYQLMRSHGHETKLLFIRGLSYDQYRAGVLSNLIIGTLLGIPLVIVSSIFLVSDWSVLELVAIDSILTSVFASFLLITAFLLVLWLLNSYFPRPDNEPIGIEDSQFLVSHNHNLTHNNQSNSLFLTLLTLPAVLVAALAWVTKEYSNLLVLPSEVQNIASLVFNLTFALLVILVLIRLLERPETLITYLGKKIIPPEIVRFVKQKTQTRLRNLSLFMLILLSSLVIVQFSYITKHTTDNQLKDQMLDSGEVIFVPPSNLKSSVILAHLENLSTITRFYSVYHLPFEVVFPNSNSSVDTEITLIDGMHDFQIQRGYVQGTTKNQQVWNGFLGGVGALVHESFSKTNRLNKDDELIIQPFMKHHQSQFKVDLAGTYQGGIDPFYCPMIIPFSIFERQEKQSLMDYLDENLAWNEFGLIPDSVGDFVRSYRLDFSPSTSFDALSSQLTKIFNMSSGTITTTLKGRIQLTSELNLDKWYDKQSNTNLLTLVSSSEVYMLIFPGFLTSLVCLVLFDWHSSKQLLDENKKHLQALVLRGYTSSFIKITWVLFPITRQFLALSGSFILSMVLVSLLYYQPGSISLAAPALGTYPRRSVVNTEFLTWNIFALLGVFVFSLIGKYVLLKWRTIEPLEHLIARDK